MKFSAIFAPLAVLAATASATNVVNLVAPTSLSTVTAGVPFTISLQATIQPNVNHQPLNYYIGQQALPSSSSSGDVGPELADISSPVFAATSTGLFLNTSVVLNTLGQVEISVVEFFVGGPTLNSHIPGTNLMQVVVNVV